MLGEEYLLDFAHVLSGVQRQILIHYFMLKCKCGATNCLTSQQFY